MLYLVDPTSYHYRISTTDQLCCTRYILQAIITGYLLQTSCAVPGRSYKLSLQDIYYMQTSCAVPGIFYKLSLQDIYYRPAVLYLVYPISYHYRISTTDQLCCTRYILQVLITGYLLQTSHRLCKHSVT